MFLTRKQRAVLRLSRTGLGPTQIARETGLHRQTVQKLKARAMRNLRDAGLDPVKLLQADKYDLLELAI